MLTFDHLKLVQHDVREVKRFRDYLLRLQGSGTVEEMGVQHENDDSCCQREPWPATQAQLLTVLRALVVQSAGAPEAIVHEDVRHVPAASLCQKLHPTLQAVKDLARRYRVLIAMQELHAEGRTTLGFTPRVPEDHPQATAFWEAWQRFCAEQEEGVE
jgi:hypothetical protein